MSSVKKIYALNKRRIPMDNLKSNNQKMSEQLHARQSATSANKHIIKQKAIDNQSKKGPAGQCEKFLASKYNVL